MVFQWSVLDSKSPHVCRTLLIILADLNVVDLDGLYLSSYLQVFQFFYQSFGYSSKFTNYSSYNRHLFDF